MLAVLLFAIVYLYLFLYVQSIALKVAHDADIIKAVAATVCILLAGIILSIGLYLVIPEELAYVGV